MKNYAKRLISAFLLPAALAGALALNANAQESYAGQSTTQQTTQQTTQSQQEKKDEPQAGDKKIKVSGLAVNGTQLSNPFSTSTASLNFITFPDGSELWPVFGHRYGNREQGFDAGLKYLRGKNLLRMTLDQSFLGGKSRTSAGLDGDVFLGSYGKFDLSVLGDISTVKKENRFTNFGVGMKAASGGNTLFALYSNRGPENKNGIRVGYIFKDSDVFVAAHADYTQGAKPSFAGYFSLPEDRFMLSYDANTHTVSSINIITIGNAPLPRYARQGFLESQNILTRRSVTDSDYTVYFPASFFSAPKKKVSYVIRINLDYDTKQGKLKNLKMDNALTIGRVVLSQNYDRATGKNHYGGGIGYRILGNNSGSFTPVVKYEKGTGLSIDLNLFF